ncbi:MAG TPA: PLP-dependent transferase [Jatrophihabitans sp.]|uniref:trans-sulfuration enzyme family protein n=1 Tax=Jatrophihabitans sp. TaxID=1932789 RepID=UPI002E042252|nr:PLP-dependent transferase [Jatrophihabitans sp.]
MDESKLHPESLVVAGGRPHAPGAPLNAPIVLAAPFRHDGEQNRYSRHDVTDTLAAFEDILGELEGGRAFGFSSGIAAIAAVVEGRPTGAVAVVPADAYSGTVSIFRAQQDLGRLELRPVDPGDTAAVITALDGADLLWLETVTNPLMTVPDLVTLAAAAHAAGALVGVDATFSTPLVVRPLDLGADIVMHSVTKYLSGHSDVLMGALVVRDPELAEQVHARRTMTGALPGALETYLATRGLRTLALRMERAQANAADLAVRLSAHPRVTRVRFPGLPGDPGHAVAARDFAGFGAMIAFEIDGTADDAERLCESLRLINHGTSLGGVESLIERRARHAIDASFGTPANLLRLSVGIEHVEDLWADLAKALG